MRSESNKREGKDTVTVMREIAAPKKHQKVKNKKEKYISPYIATPYTIYGRQPTQRKRMHM